MSITFSHGHCPATQHLSSPPSCWEEPLIVPIAHRHVHPFRPLPVPQVEWPLQGEFSSSSSQCCRLCFLFHVLSVLHSAMCLRGWRLRTGLTGSFPFGLPVRCTSWMLRQEMGGLPLLTHHRPASLQQKPRLLRRLSWNPSFPSPGPLAPPSHFRLRW